MRAKPVGRIGVAAALLLLIGCGEDLPSESVGFRALPATTETVEVDPELLAAAAVQRVTVDNSFSRASVFDRVSVVDGLVDATDPDDPPIDFVAPAHELDGAAKAAIERALPYPVEWISFERVHELASVPDVAGERPLHAILELGVPVVEDGAAQVFSVLGCGVNCFTAGTHVLDRGPDGTWAATGSVGVTIVS